MKIETKYNIGDKVYYLFENEIYNSHITSIHVIVDDNIPFVIYKVEPYDERVDWYREHKLFPTKEELLKSL